jgi:transcriptional regulator with XRE-family HTH domain
MTRTKPVKSVVEVLRRKLGLHQEEFAERVGLSRRTLQNIEYGAPLSWKSARGISLQFNISGDWLMANDPDAPMVTETGEPWTPKTQGKLQRALRSIDPALVKGVVSVVAEQALRPLLEDYLKFRPFFMVAGLADPAVIARWREIQDRTWNKFKKAYPVLAEQSQEPSTGGLLSRAALESIKDDLEVVIQMPTLLEKQTAKKEGLKK